MPGAAVDFSRGAPGENVRLRRFQEWCWHSIRIRAERVRAPAEPEHEHGKRIDTVHDKRMKLVVQSRLLLFERFLIPLEARPFI